MVQCKKYSESTAGNGTQRKTVIFTADIFAVYICAKDMTVPFKIMKLVEVHDKTEITMGLQGFNSLKLEVFCRF